MLLWFVVAYWVISVAIGLVAARWVHNTKDFAVAGRRLPMYIVTATVFATWFGSETVLGIPATFIKEGFSGVVADPFGSSLCLVLVGLFFARPLYRMNLLTIGDYYRKRYSRPVEMLTTLCIVISYLGWVGAQIKALGLVFNVVSAGWLSQESGMIIGAATVLVYTMLGGMFSVAITDFIQMIIIVLGMLYIAWEVSGLAGGAGSVVAHAASVGKFHILPAPELKDVLWFLAAWITMMLGSVPQQDVFQRVQSAKDENTAARSSILGGVLYFGFAFIPMVLAYSASLIDPKMVQGYLEKDSQLILPSLILSPIVPVFAQIMFFGALLSAIKSCASATLLAPSVTFSENILKPFFPHIGDKKFLRLMQLVLVGFTVLVTFFALK
ncbi:MAG TPA: sodium:solute symporter family protein, partial [Usitatibacter sp.]|nr:sodium:solute symporter family protein [Usitatibacter sp.]